MPTNDPRTPESIAGAVFSSAFRGYDQAEVRRFLEQVADRVRALTTERDALRDQPAPELDEATASALLGEEAGRILATAREGAAQVRQRAEENAARMVQQAQEQADRLRAEVADDVARQRADVAAEAEATREAAREEGRQMVAEARAVRERMLADLARRRDAARLQLEQLRLTREDILAAFESAGASVREAMDRAAGTVDRAVADVRATDDELPPEPPAIELPDPGTGPNPVVVVEGVAAAVVEEGAGADAPAEVVVEAADVELGDVAIDGTAPDIAVDIAEAAEPAGEGGPVEPVDEGAIEVADLASATAEEVVAGAAAGDAPAGEVPSAQVPAGGVDALFSRLGRAAPDAVAAATREAVQEAAMAPALVVEGPEGEAEALAARDGALAPLVSALSRHLKRALSDEQNEVLDTVRRRPVPDALHDLLGTQAAHAERYRAVAEEDLWAAASVGARSVAHLDDTALHGALDRTGVLEAGLDDVSGHVVAPLRERLARALQQSGGDGVEAASLLRAAYREWKTQRVDELAEQLVVESHGRGAFAAVPDGARIRWVLGGARCAECESNAGATVGAGQVFPSGARHAPAHSGCRCLNVRIAG